MVAVETLRVNNLIKTFGGLEAVKGISFEVHEGSIFGLIGPNGAGKTTTFNIIAGAEKPTSGNVYLNGEDVTGLSPEKQYKLGLVRTFQLSHEYPKMTSLENLMVAASDQPGEKIFMNWLSPKTVASREKEVTERALDSLNFLGLYHVKDELAGNLSAPPYGCHFLNFTASHDGIGVRPLEGILPHEEILSLAEEVRKKGGFVSMRKLEDGTESPYELNATYFSALSDPNDEKLGQARFQCSQAVALAMKGIPAIYFHSLCGSSNNRNGVRQTGHNRTINRKKWEIGELDAILKGEGSPSEVFEWYARTLRRRSACPAFHPEGTQAI